MPIIKIETKINAPIEIVFDLARSIDLHKKSQSKHKEKAIAGKTSGLIELNESVTWQANHFGVPLKLTSRITKMNRPFHFRDSMVSGAFKTFDHDHFFEKISEMETLMKDTFDFETPFGFIGNLVNFLFLERYMKKLLIDRAQVIKLNAESEEKFNYI